MGRFYNKCKLYTKQYKYTTRTTSDVNINSAVGREGVWGWLGGVCGGTVYMGGVAGGGGDC